MAKNNKNNVNETVNETVNPGVQGAFEAFLSENKLSVSDIRKMLTQSGRNSARQNDAKRAIESAIPGVNLNGLNLSAMEFVFSIASDVLPNDGDVARMTRPDCVEKAIAKALSEGKTEKDADTGASVRSASQAWRSLLDNKWHITLTAPNGKTFKK